MEKETKCTRTAISERCKRTSALGETNHKTYQGGSSDDTDCRTRSRSSVSKSRTGFCRSTCPGLHRFRPSRSRRCRGTDSSGGAQGSHPPRAGARATIEALGSHGRGVSVRRAAQVAGEQAARHQEQGIQQLQRLRSCLSEQQHRTGCEPPPHVLRRKQRGASLQNAQRLR
jgi:hypothetical protein